MSLFISEMMQVQPVTLRAALGSVACHSGLASEATVGHSPAAHDPL
jgi:hypothetical protein